MLIAVVFSMFNRYVDGWRCSTLFYDAAYDLMGQWMADERVRA